MYKREDYVRAVELIATGQVVTGPLMSKHLRWTITSTLTGSSTAA